MDGAAGKTFDDIRSEPCFSSDGKRMAYVARRGLKVLAVVDGVEGKEYDHDDTMMDKIRLTYDIRFSPDSQHVAYVAKEGGKQFLVLDGVEGKAYDQIWWYKSPFSPDSRRTAYLAWAGGKEYVVVDGQEGKAYRDAYGLVWSPDSKQIAFKTGTEKGECVVVDGAEGRPYDRILMLTGFSPDSRHFAYVALRPVGNGCSADSVVVDGNEAATFDTVVRLQFDGPNRLSGLAKNQGKFVRFEIRAGAKKIQDRPGATEDKPTVSPTDRTCAPAALTSPAAWTGAPRTGTWS
jgi:hypothetical protein